ncbi:molybdenum cofactor sulfurase isoform X1 [Patella vulgata]|uniref:molybdenum cofactor sulfurase isoform X1 n=2 Tax=Patella vulgata TaxID=6465 RepID=UPI0021803840|nr:molybdenum cofactor sulfurase isoform X1 [Patella vulgata]
MSVKFSDMDFSRFYNAHIEAIRGTEFPGLGDQTYVDHAGTTLYAKSQLEAYHNDLMRHVYGNPHSGNTSSQLTTDTIEQIRYRVLQFFNTTSKEYTVIFTSGCTQALKLVAETFDFSGIQTKKEDGDKILTRNRGDNYSFCDSDSTVKKDENCKNVGYFYYLCDNHTSAQGMRELIVKQTENVFPFNVSDVFKTCISHPVNPSINGNNLFVYPAQSNYSGQKFPLEWIKKIQNSQLKCQQNTGGHWYVLLDAAAYASTSHLDLTHYKPDFVTVSFYKIFGHPTGLGALLVKNDSCHVLKKEYFGGGTVSVSSAQENFHIFRDNISERFEDGTLSFLDIIALRYGIVTVYKLTGGMEKISQHTFCIAQFFYQNLQQLHHSNGRSLAEIYTVGDFKERNRQGAIINFNLIRYNGDYIGFAEVDKMAQLHNIHLRTGCFCNIGACQKYLNISTEQLKSNFQEGHVCGDDKDLINGKPTGSVRISFGYMSTLTDAVKCLQFIIECFLQGSNPSPLIIQQAEDIVKKSLVEKTTMVHSKQHPNELGYKDVIVGTTVVTESKPTADVVKKCGENKRLLTNIFIYPIKSCAAFEVKDWVIGNKGLLYDREWMIVSDSGVTISQKREQRLCLLKPFIDLQEQKLYLNFPGMPQFILSLESSDQTYTGQICTNKVCGDKVETFDCGEEVSDWVSLALGRSGCRLLRHKIEDSRKCKLKDTVSESKAGNEISLANESQFLLLSRESVKALVKRIQEDNDQIFREKKESELLETATLGEENLISRFRANLVIGGGLKFEEDNWSNINIGSNKMVSQGGCSRCQMICLDQTTGTRSKEPLKTLASWRGRKVPFGIHVRMESLSETQNVLTVGDTVMPV